jgi:hypothetical protein
MLLLAFSQSPMVPNPQRVPAGVCRQNGALPVCAAASWGIEPNATITAAAAKPFMGRLAG